MASMNLYTCKHPQSISNHHHILGRKTSVNLHSCLFDIFPLKASSAKSRFLSLKVHKMRPTQIFNSGDNPSIASTSAKGELPLKIGIIGFGNFGQFIAKGIIRQGHKVLAASRSDYSEYCQHHGIKFFGDVEELCEDQPDVIFICSSILSTESVVRSIPFHKLKPDTIFADVLSVKQFPRNLFLEVLPPGFGIICTHPMFGPESGKNGWAGLPFAFDKVRAVDNSAQDENCRQFLGIFANEGCRMVEMSCEEHDRHAAGSQFVTHTIGRILSHLDLESTPINTKGFESLLQLTESTVSDSFDLYYGLFMYNVNSTEQIKNLDRAFETVKRKLFGRLHDILRKQIVERVPAEGSASSSSYFLPSSKEIKELASFSSPAHPSPPQDQLTSGTVSAQFHKI